MSPLGRIVADGVRGVWECTLFHSRGHWACTDPQNSNMTLYDPVHVFFDLEAALSVIQNDDMPARIVRFGQRFMDRVLEQVDEHTTILEIAENPTAPGLHRDVHLGSMLAEIRRKQDPYDSIPW